MIKVGKLIAIEERGPYDINGTHIDKYWMASILCNSSEQRYGKECYQFRANPEKICKLAGVNAINDLGNNAWEWEISSKRLEDVRKVG